MDTLTGDVDSKKLDGILLEILWNRLIAICDEAMATQIRTSFSPIVRESRDCVVAVLDPTGNLLAENTGTLPVFVGVLEHAMKKILERLPVSTWAPGDAVLSNDPWLGPGHKPDYLMVAPVFHQGRVAGFVGDVAHLADVGGAVWAADCRSVYEEGLGIPPQKWMRAGKVNEDLRDLIAHNVRLPDDVVGDLMAMAGSLHFAGARLDQLLAEAQLPDLLELGEAINHAGETAMRKAIAALPDGKYEGVTWLNGYIEPLKLQATITVEGDRLNVDFSGSASEVTEGGINVVLPYTQAYTHYPLKCLLDPATKRCSGSLRPVTIYAPPGSILNAQFPAPVNARTLVGDCIVNLVFQAFEGILPDRVLAESGTTPPSRIALTGKNEKGQQFAFILFANGGMGARASADGLDTTPFPTNVTCASIEVMETLVPVIVWKKDLRLDSGGPGEFRGGLGQDVIFEVVGKDPIVVSTISEKWTFPPLGRFGGQPALPHLILKVRGDGVIPQKGRCDVLPGEQVLLSVAGGGGFGPPENRSKSLVAKDLAEGLISEDVARKVYKASGG